jgi:hypothetical protein
MFNGDIYLPLYLPLCSNPQGARGAKRGVSPLRPEGEKEVTHLDLGQVDRGLVNLRGRGEVGLEIAGQRLARKVSLGIIGAVGKTQGRPRLN